MRSIRPHALTLLVATGLMSLSACSARIGGDGRSLSEHNDELRHDNQALRQQIDETQEKLALLESELRVYRHDTDPARAIPDAVTPVFSAVEFGRYSGPIDNDRDGFDDEVRLYVKPTDQQGRTLVVPGRAVVQLLDVTGDEPAVLAERTWEPGEWDEAHRSGFTGDHFTLVLPLPDDLRPGLDTLNVVLELTEANRGTVRRAQAVYPLHR
ncbi:MAG: hypothetical protein AAGF84_14055 [Planctomycetota bacterium]